MIQTIKSEVQTWLANAQTFLATNQPLESMSYQELETRETMILELNKSIDETFKRLRNVKEDADQTDSLENEREIDQFYTDYDFSIVAGNRVALILQRDITRLALCRMGKGVNNSVDNYIEVTPLANRVIILGCGHTDTFYGCGPPEESSEDEMSIPDEEYNHLHVGEYCVDIRAKMKPDVCLDITSTKMMEYFPDNSFPKIICENLPDVVFEEGDAQKIFTSANRILQQGGIIQFNNYLQISEYEDEDYPFDIILSEEEKQAVEDKDFSSYPPTTCHKMNQKVVDFLSSVGFELQPGFNMHVLPENYIAVKTKNVLTLSA
ncbi:MAG: hypothetical protein HKM07_06205 [Chlamydiae bacterium]|nr:hypothetical protein [Chlamydiota bacterium]